MPPSSEQLILQRFDRLEANVEKMSEALVKIARIDERNAGLQEVIAGQSKVLTKLSDEITDGLKRAHERIDSVSLVGERWSNWMANFSDKINDLERTKFSVSESAHEIATLKATVCELKGQIEPLTTMRNRLIGALLALSVASGALTWFVNREISRLDHAQEVNLNTINRLSLELDRLQNRGKP